VSNSWRKCDERSEQSETELRLKSSDRQGHRDRHPAAPAAFVAHGQLDAIKITRTGTQNIGLTNGMGNFKVPNGQAIDFNTTRSVSKCVYKD
jgi:hypothetical protein